VSLSIGSAVEQNNQQGLGSQSKPSDFTPGEHSKRN